MISSNNNYIRNCLLICTLIILMLAQFNISYKLHEINEHICEELNKHRDPTNNNSNNENDLLAIQHYLNIGYLESKFKGMRNKDVVNELRKIKSKIEYKCERSFPSPNKKLIHNHNNVQGDTKITRGYVNTCVSPGMFALSFDDGPSIHTKKLLDILSQKNVTATFFVNGKKFVEDENLAKITKEAHDKGHDIGSHSYSHQDFKQISDEAINEEIDKNTEAIQKLIGKRPIYFRVPYFSSDEAIINKLNDKNYETIFVNLDTKDYLVHESNPNEIVNKIKEVLSDSNVSPQTSSFISLQHDIHQESVDMVPMIIDSVKEKNYRFVSMHECRGHSSAYV